MFSSFKSLWFQFNTHVISAFHSQPNLSFAQLRALEKMAQELFLRTQGVKWLKDYHILLSNNWDTIFKETEVLKIKNENLEPYSSEPSDKKIIEYYYPIGPLERSMKL